MVRVLVSERSYPSLDNGDVLCVFAEGEITRTSTLLPFRRGVERFPPQVVPVEAPSAPQQRAVMNVGA